MSPTSIVAAIGASLRGECDWSSLSRREQEVWQMTLEGVQSPEIAESLFISVRTVETHRANILKKLQANYGQ